MTTTQDNISYYGSLLILQYLQKLKAKMMVEATVAPVLLGDSSVQSLSFFPPPTTGTFVLNYDGSSTIPINWNDSAVTIQGNLNGILTSPLTVAVTGSIADGLLFSFSNFDSPVQLLSVSLNSTDGLPSITSVGEQLPLEVQNGFNLIGPDYASGVQLDVIGKYVGVSRTGFGFYGPITLNDSEFLQFIQMAIIRNAAGSSLAAIQSFLNQFFPGIIFVLDSQNMHLTYTVDISISTNLLQLFISEQLLPKPMGVGISTVVQDNFFSFRTYQAPAPAGTTPFNNYSPYILTWKWLSYSDAV